MTDSLPLPDSTSDPDNAAPAFEAETRVFSLDDILAAAEARGALAAFRTAWETRQNRARAAAAAGFSPSAPDLEAATDAFRYARDLVSADECEHWLAQRGLTFEALTSSVSRRLQAELADAPAAAEPGETDAATFRIDALLADDFSSWARALAWRVALACDQGTLPPVDPAVAHGWSKWDEAFRVASAALTTPEHRRRELATQRLQLVRVDVAAAEFATAGAAREAVFCVREDGIALAELAAANGFHTWNHAGFLGELTPDWYQALVSASPGDAAALLTSHGRPVVLQLRGKQEPALDDPAVCARIDADLRRQYFGKLEAEHVRWLINVDLDP